MNIEKVQLEIREQFERAGILPFLVEDSSQLLDLNDKIFAEIVLFDNGKTTEARDLVERLLADTQSTLVLRSN